MLDILFQLLVQCPLHNEIAQFIGVYYSIDEVCLEILTEFNTMFTLIVHDVSFHFYHAIVRKNVMYIPLIKPQLAR